MPGQFVVHERDNLDRQRPERRIRKHACGSERRPHIGLQFGRHQCGGESFSADIRAQDRDTFRIDNDDIVQVAADDPGGMVHRCQSQPRTVGNGDGNSDR